MGINIAALTKDDFDWSDGKRSASLGADYDKVLAKFDDAISWYQHKKIAKRWLARWLRIGAILLGTVGTAMPTLSEMALRQGTTTLDQSFWLRPGITTLIGLAVGAMIMLDRLIGASSGWLRYSTAETTLKELKDEMVLTYSLERSSWNAAQEPTVEQTKHAIFTLKGFLARANQIVREETAQWKAEFQSVVTQTDENAKTPLRRIEEAALTVKLTNPERLADGWEVSINGGAYILGASDTKTFQLTAGMVSIRVRATIKKPDGSAGTTTYATETTEPLAAGASKVVPIVLPGK